MMFTNNTLTKNCITYRFIMLGIHQNKIGAPAVRGILTYDYNTVNSYVSNGRNAIVEKIPGYYTGIYVNYTKKIIKARSIEYHLDTTGRFTDLDMSTQVNHVFKGYMGPTSNV